MNLAYEYGATRIWLVNVGDLKPLEIPLEFFIRMAWDPAAMTKEIVITISGLAKAKVEDAASMAPNVSIF